MQSKIVLIKLVSVLVTVYHIKEKAFIIIKKKKDTVLVAILK